MKLKDLEVGHWYVDCDGDRFTPTGLRGLHRGGYVVMSDEGDHYTLLEAGWYNLHGFEEVPAPVDFGV